MLNLYLTKTEKYIKNEDIIQNASGRPLFKIIVIIAITTLLKSIKIIRTFKILCSCESVMQIFKYRFAFLFKLEKVIRSATQQTAFQYIYTNTLSFITLKQS